MQFGKIVLNVHTGWEITSVFQDQVKETFSQATKNIKLFSFKLPDAISLAIDKISIF
jgi:hypothetical protein